MSTAECTCPCHQGAVTGCGQHPKPCCTVPEIAHDATVICPYCKGLTDKLSSHVLDCTGNKHLMPEGRRALSATLAAAHRARR